MIIDGKKIAEGLREKLKKKIKEFKSNLKIETGLSVILILLLMFLRNLAFEFFAPALF